MTGRLDDLRSTAETIEQSLDRLSVVASARRHGEQMVALTLDANAVCLERLISLSSESAALEADPFLAELLWVHRPTPTEAEALGDLDERVESALSAIEQSGVPDLAHWATEAVATVTELYGEGFARTFELLHELGQRATIEEALADGLVAGALVVHDLHPDTVDDRARATLRRLAETLPATGPIVELDRIDEAGQVVLRVGGEPVRDRWRVAVAAERAVRAVTPDAADVIVEGADPEAVEVAGSHEAFIPLASVGRRGRSVPSRWVEVPELGSVGPGEIARLGADDVRLLACRIGADLYVAVDPFEPDCERLWVDEARPPSVHASTGVSFVFTEPLPVQQSGDRYEVSVP